MFTDMCLCWHAAQPVGIVAGLSGAGAIASSPAGWPAVFYVTGTIGILVGLWVAFSVADCPEQHRSMSQKERDYMATTFVVAPSNERVNYFLFKRWYFSSKRICRTNEMHKIQMWNQIIFRETNRIGSLTSEVPNLRLPLRPLTCEHFHPPGCFKIDKMSNIHRF